MISWVIDDFFSIRRWKTVQHEPTKLWMHLQNAKEIKQLDGPLKNWAIFYGRSLINPAILYLWGGVSKRYTHQYLYEAQWRTGYDSCRPKADVPTKQL